VTVTGAALAAPHGRDRRSAVTKSTRPRRPLPGHGHAQGGLDPGAPVSMSVPVRRGSTWCSLFVLDRVTVTATRRGH
jgi:hypothetical protein